MAASPSRSEMYEQAMMRYARSRFITQVLNWHRLALATIFMAGLFLRLYGLGSESLWFDEAFSFSVAQMDIMQIVFSTTRDNNPPLYYLILHYWMLLAGNSEFAIRLPSAISGALAVPVIYGIGKLLFSRVAGLIAALILSLSAYHIRFSQEARTYSLMVFLGLLSFYFFLKLLKDPPSRSTTAGYVVSTSLLMYSHVYSIFLIGAQVLYLLITRQDLRRWVVPATFVALLYVPGLARIAMNLLLPQGAWKSGGMDWVPAPTFSHVVDFFILYSGPIPLVITFVLLSAFGLYDLARSKRGSTAWLLLAWLLVPIVVPFVVSHLYRPMLLDKYTIAASPALYLLVARGVEGLRSVKYSSVLLHARILFAIGVTVFSLATALDYYTATTKEPWRQVAGYVNGHAKPGDLILFYRSSGKALFGYYFQREDVNQEVVSLESSSPPVTRKEMREGLAPAVEGNRRVWLVRHYADNSHFNKRLKKALVNLSGGVAYQDVYNRKIDDPYKNWSTWYPQDHIVLFLFAERKTR
jgi:mannosyltransferase